MATANSETTTTTVGKPLNNGFTFWYMRRGKGSNKDKNPTTTNEDKQAQESIAKPDDEKDANSSKPTNPHNPYESSIKQIATVHTVEQFWTTYDFLTRPNDLPTTTDYHFFRAGIKPTWEDPSNARGGKWIVRLRKGLASRYWEEIVLALIGSQLTSSIVPDGEVCGAVVSIRYAEDIVSVWNKTASDRDITDRLRDGIKRILQLPSFVHMEYKPHETSLQDKSSFRNTQVWKPKSAMEREAGSGGGAGGSDRGDVTRSSMRKGSWGEREDRGVSGSGKSKRDVENAWR
jgi:translation initiation factor 4E